MELKENFSYNIAEKSIQYMVSIESLLKQSNKSCECY